MNNSFKQLDQIKGNRFKFTANEHSILGNAQVTADDSGEIIWELCLITFSEKQVDDTGVIGINEVGDYKSTSLDGYYHLTDNEIKDFMKQVVKKYGDITIK